MLGQLIAYDATGNVTGTLHYVVAKDEDGKVIGLIDFAAHENAGGRLRDIWENSKAVGSATWPEWVGGAAYDFKVELEPDPAPARARLKALVHKKSGYRRERAAIETAIAERINEKKAAAAKAGEQRRKQLANRGLAPEIVAQFSDPPPEPADLRDLLGGPNRPLLLDDEGKTKARAKSKRPNLPVVKRS